MQNLNTHPVDPALQTERLKRTEAEKALQRTRDRFHELKKRVNEHTTELLRTNRQLKQEIDDRNRIEKKLRESEERYRALFENNPVETVIVDNEARVIGYNLAKKESDGRLPEIGDVMYRDYAGRHDINMLKELKECIRSGMPKEFPEQRYKSRFLHIRISPFPGGAIITSIDIGYRKQVEEALRESERRYRTLVETIPHGIQEIDTSGKITFANSVIYKIFDYDEGELTGRSITDLAATEDDRMALGAFLADMTRERQVPVSYQHKCRTKGGRIIEVQTDFDYKRDQRGALTGFVSIITDITQRHQAEQEKKDLEKQLYHAQKMEAIGTLAGGIAHDFNNILGSILLNAELAIDDLPTQSETQYSLNQVVKGCRHAKDLIEQILTFSREAEFERKPLQVDILVKETLKMLRAMFPATIEIEQKMGHGLKTVLADPTQIQQLVINLCNNGAHAMGAAGGKLVVALSNEVVDTPPAGSDLQPGPYVKLVVSDMGCGIRPEVREHIFEPFFTTKRPGEGTGLGLSVVHGIAINHEGSITMESEPGRGTTFQVYLPAMAETGVSKTEAEPKRLQTGNEKILFVDDEEVVVDASVRILERLGYEVAPAMSGNEALKVFRAQPEHFDLVITDMTMPGMTGIELARELMQTRPDIPIVLCTGYSQLITPEDINTMGIKEFIVKPFNKSEIAAVIRSVLEKSSTA